MQSKTYSVGGDIQLYMQMKSYSNPCLVSTYSTPDIVYLQPTSTAWRVSPTPSPRSCS